MIGYTTVQAVGMVALALFIVAVIAVVVGTGLHEMSRPSLHDGAAIREQRRDRNRAVAEQADQAAADFLRDERAFTPPSYRRGVDQ